MPDKRDSVTCPHCEGRGHEGAGDLEDDYPCRVCKGRKMTAKPTPYEYHVEVTLRVRADGQHADGDGAAAVAKRLCKALEADEFVVSATHGPPLYMKRTLETPRRPWEEKYPDAR